MKKAIILLICLAFSRVPGFSQIGLPGDIKVYFNQSIDPTIGISGNSPFATSGNQCSDATILAINSAKQTLDIAMYNTNYVAFVTAVKAAVARGVRVRYIADAEQTNSALSGSLPFPVLYGSETENGIMHNKFMIIDAHAQDSTQCWVTTGSMNWTTYQVLSDPNNLVMIQSQAVALAYETEFQEMWGSNGANYDKSKAKFGAAKTDNTPHSFVVRGVPIEVYFSPSDQPHAQIQKALSSAQSSLDFGVLLITKDDLASQIIQKHNAGVKVRGIVDDADQPYYTMKNAGVNIFLHTPGSIFHHKYLIADANLPNSDPTVLTGSHNWTYSAHTYNDENTVIIHNHTIADLYRKEFNRRYAELAPSSTFALEPQTEWNVGPNPSYGKIFVTGNDESFDYQIFTTVGQLCGAGTSLSEISVIDLLPGYYFLKLTQANGAQKQVSFIRH